VIPTNARKKFRFDVVPSDRQLWAIGMVVVQWTAVEQMVKTFVHSFTNEDDRDDSVRKVFDSTRSMSIRLDQWEELAKLHVEREWLKPMLTLINGITVTVHKIHKAWMLDSSRSLSALSPQFSAQLPWLRF
jgi:hypothetical protein